MYNTEIFSIHRDYFEEIIEHGHIQKQRILLDINLYLLERPMKFNADFWPHILVKNKFWNLDEKSIHKSSHMSLFLNFIHPISVTMVTCRRTIGRAHFALFRSFFGHC